MKIDNGITSVGLIKICCQKDCHLACKSLSEERIKINKTTLKLLT